MSKSKIEWTDATWNPTTGCTKVSEGCRHCYAERMAKRQVGRNGYPADDPFRLTLRPDRLEQPLHWRKPRRVFVDSMSDLFHVDVPDEFIDRVFAVMALAGKHTFQLLTKRPQRAADYLGSRGVCADYWKKAAPDGYTLEWERGALVQFPLPNVWIGTSVEDQKTADERVPLLLGTPAAVRFLSCEPLLGPVDLTEVKQDLGDGLFGDALQAHHIPRAGRDRDYPSINWVIVGGESGPKSRPMHPAWVKSLRDQCHAADVPFFFKQWGEWAPIMPVPWPQRPHVDPLRRCHKFEDETRVWHWHKWQTGNKLDGHQHLEYPEVAVGQTQD